MRHLTTEELEAGLDEIRRSPRDEGVLERIVRRPAVDAREVLEEAILDPEHGLVGDDWVRRVREALGDPARPDSQLTIMNARAAALVAQDPERWPLSGDQLFIDLELSDDSLPTGTRLAIGSAIIEVTAKPHNGCKKFVARFGLHAMKFVNSSVGKQLHLRGIYAKVIERGEIRVGDAVRRV